MATSEGGNSVETISSEEISHSYAFFHRLCMTDKLSEKEAKLFFEKSLLPDKEFNQIWKLSDLNKNGFLTVGDFIIFVHFVKERLLGVSLPEEVPSSWKDKAQPFKVPSCSDEHIAKCKMVFREYKQFVDYDGKMDVEGAKFLLSRSKLTSSQLFHIWKLSDVDCDGKLLFTEFVVAIHLVNLVLKGYSLPVSLKHKYILKSKKIKPPDLTIPVSKVKSAHIPWIQSGSAPLPTTTTTDKSSSHFVLPSTPLSPGPGLPTPEHPFMSFSTFARYGPPSPLLKRQHGAPTSTLSAQSVQNGGLKPKPQYVNLLVSENGPVPPGSEASSSLPPPPLPPRLQTTPQPTLIPSPTPSPSHVSPVPVRMVPISISSTPSPPPPTPLSIVDPNLEFMKSLEDLTSIGSFDLLHSLSPPLSPLVSTDTKKKSTEQQLMEADLDDLVAALSEMESTVLSLDNSPKISAKVQPEKKAVKVERRKSEPVDTSQLLDDSDIGKLEDAIEGAIRDASPVQEVDLLAKDLLKQHQQPQRKESEEYVDLIASLQSVAVVGESQKGPEKTGHVGSLKPIGDKVADRGQRTKPPVSKNKPNIKALRNGTKVGKVESEDPLGLDSYLKEELDSMNQVLEQFN